MIRLAVFGASGMLGGYVESYFRRNDVDVIPIARGDVLTEAAALRDRLRELAPQPLTIVNCVGVIKPQIAVQGSAETIRINSLFPHVLARVAEDLGHQLIHITTDCVFSGREGRYAERAPHDEGDIYGRTKSLGEPENCLVIRTSIIGEERLHQRSLIEWAKSQAGQQVRGFSNHTWNGVTCLEFAKVVHRLLQRNISWTGVRHLFSPREVSKYELLGLISDAFDLDLKIQPSETPIACHRTLATDYPELLASCEIPDIRQQLEDLRRFRWV